MGNATRYATITLLTLLALAQSGFGAGADQWGGNAVAAQSASGTQSRQTVDRANDDLAPLQAYKDYLIRSQVTEGAAIAGGAEVALAEFYSVHGEWPQNNAQAGLSPAASIVGKYVSSVDVGVRPGTIVVTYGSQAAAAPIHGKGLALSAITKSNVVGWSCLNSMTTIPHKYLPSSCEKSSE